MYTFISKVGRKVCIMFKRNMSTAVLCYLVMMCGLVLAGCGKNGGFPALPSPRTHGDPAN